MAGMARVSFWSTVADHGYEVHVWPPRPGIPRWTMIASGANTMPTVRNEDTSVEACAKGLHDKMLEGQRRLA